MLLSSLAAALFSAATAPLAAAPLSVTTEQIGYFHIGSSNNKAGKLTFVGGLEIESGNEDFGGFSGLRIDAKTGRLFAVSDNSHWLTATIERSPEGIMTGLADADLSCICRTDGTPYGSKHWGDAEAVEIDGNRAYIGFERLNRINGYDLKADFTLGAPAQVTASFKPAKIEYNEGIESIALAPAFSPHAGTFIVVTEESLNPDGNNRAFIANGSGLQEFSVTRTDDYSVTDIAFMPGGDLLILERRFGLSVGAAIRIRRIAGQLIRPDATLPGEVLLEAGLTSRIDNMEGITAWRGEDGKTHIAIISDDNFTRFQRTLLLEFRLDD